MAKKKTRLAMVCPCCGGEVTSRRYGFNVIRPPRFSTWYVCNACEAALTGPDAAARHAAVLAFMNYLEGVTNEATAA